MFRVFFTVLLFLCFAMPALSQQQISLDLTIYSNNFGVIRDVRDFKLNSGLNNIEFSGVPQTISPESIFLKFNGQILEQSFRNDLESRSVIFNKLLNRKLTLTKPDAETIRGELLTFNDGFMMKTGTGDIVMLSDINNYQITAGDLPNDLVTTPTIFWKLFSAKEGNQNLAINYLFDGIIWKAAYVALINDNETQMDIDAKFSLTNNSGFAIKNANVNLISGKVIKVADNNQSFNKRLYSQGDGGFVAAIGLEETASEDLSDYQVYNLKTPLNLDNNESKQLGMFTAENVKIVRKKRFIAYGGGSSNPVNSIVSFKNVEQSGLGKLLPQGKMSFYKNRNGKPEFIGESRIPIKNIGDSLELYIGDVSGITGVNNTLNSTKTNTYFENELEIVLTNRTDKDEDVEILIQKGYLGSIVKSSIKFTKIDANLEKCTVKVPKKGEFQITYTLRNTIVKE